MAVDEEKKRLEKVQEEKLKSQEDEGNRIIQENASIIKKISDQEFNDNVQQNIEDHETKMKA